MSFRPRILLAASLVLGADVAAGQCPDGSTPPCRARPAALSVAVLDFRVIGGDSSDTLLGEGLAEELTSRLGELSRLSVTSRSVVRRIRNVESKPIDEIGRAANASFLVQGSLRRTAGRLRITAEMVRASTGALAWSAQYDQANEDILAIQQVVATSVAQAIAGRLLPAERGTLATRPTRNAEAYSAYLRGRAHYARRLSVLEVQHSVEEFRRAVTRDPRFGEAWGWLSVLHSTAYWTYLDRTEARLHLALDAASRARALAPNVPTTHLAFAMYYYRGRRDYGRALQFLSAAQAANPRDPTVHNEIANVARRQGDFELSLASRTRAVELDPANGGELLERAVTLRPLRRWAEADRDLQLALAITPGLFTVHAYRAYVALARDGSLAAAPLDSVAAHAGATVRSMWSTSAGVALWRFEGPHQDALLHSAPPSDTVDRIAYWLAAGFVHAARADSASLRAASDSLLRLSEARLRERPDDDLLLATLAYAYAGLGNCEAALSHAERAIASHPVSHDALTGPARLETLAEVEARCGKTESAIDRIEALVEMPSNLTPQRLRADPAFAALRSNARFARLVHAP